jgi:hypothetical protein
MSDLTHAKTAKKLYSEVLKVLDDGGIECVYLFIGFYTNELMGLLQTCQQGSFGVALRLRGAGDAGQRTGHSLPASTTFG